VKNNKGRSVKIHLWTVKKSLPTALVVGTILTTINQSALFAEGEIRGEELVRMVLNFLVPLCVATYSRVAVGSKREPGGTLPHIDSNRQPAVDITNSHAHSIKSTITHYSVEVQ
jgi:hypothetical protein